MRAGDHWRQPLNILLAAGLDGSSAVAVNRDLRVGMVGYNRWLVGRNLQLVSWKEQEPVAGLLQADRVLASSLATLGWSW